MARVRPIRSATQTLGLAVLLVASPWLAPNASAQVSVGVEAWRIASSAGTSDFEFAITPGTVVNLRPVGSGGPFALRIEVGAGRLRAAASVGVGGAEIESRSGGFRLTSDLDILTVVVANTEVSWGVTSFGERTTLRLHAGPLLERWGEESGLRTRWGGIGGLRLEVDLTGRLRLSVARSVAVIGSPILRRDADGTDAIGFKPKTLLQSVTRWGLAIRL